MKFSHFFIDRPIFASVLSILIVIVGIVSYFNLPVAQYPEVVPPTIQVTTTFPGASPQVLAETVAQPIEQQVNGVEGMLYMNSNLTSDGRMTLTITFELGTDVDEAQVLVQNRVAIAEPRLPEQVRRQGVVTRKSNPDLLLVAHVLSPDNTYDQLYISNYVQLQITDVLRRVEGVGDVNVFGAREYSMRVWLNPERLSSLDLTAEDVLLALREQNIQIAAGIIAQPPIRGNAAFQYTVRTQGRLEDPKEFARVVVKTTSDGRIVRLQDVARVELGALDYVSNSYLTKQPAQGLGISQRPGANALATARAVRQTLKELSANFPPGLEYRILFDPTVFVQESVTAVYHTILEAALLVVIVVLLFLQTWRATLIPLVAIPISLIGTFAAMAVLGFTLNNLSLFGLVLAIGIVVDDAIVVVENVERHIAEGMNPHDASRKAMEEVGGAVVSIALVLAAVFVPTAFLAGITGQFYRQFALTIAVSTLISAFVSLTLSPALTALLLRPHGARKDRFSQLLDVSLGWLFRGFNNVFTKTEHGYSRVVGKLVRATVVGLLVYAGLLLLTYVGFTTVPTGFIPAQDQGYIIIDGQLPEGASLQRTDEVARRTVDLALQVKGIEGGVVIAGFSGATRANASNSFAIFAILSSFEERTADPNQTAQAIVGNLTQKFSQITDARLAVIPPPPVSGLGTGGGFKLQVQDRGGAGLEALEEATEKLVAATRDEPAIGAAFTTFRNATPQFFAEVDRTKAKMLNVPLNRVFDALQTFLGSVYVNDFNLFGRTFRVTAQADDEYRDQPEDIRFFKTRSDNGAMVPLASLIQMRRVIGPNRVERFNLYNSAPINGNTAPGYSSGQALDAMERLAKEVLPSGMDIAWTEIAFQERLAGNTALYIFPLCVLFVFLTLAAQYESWSLPLAIILIVPMCLLSAIFGIWLRGMDNNILTQIGFVVLVGLACKNAILIVEFARQQEDQGKNRWEAAVEASRLRLRPILMTSFAFILGVLPLVIATGPGAESRQALGTAVFAGMIGVTFFGLFLTPIFYVVIRGITERMHRRRKKPEPEEPHAEQPAT